MKRHMTPLYEKMTKSGYSLNRLAAEINTYYSLNVTRFDVSNFIHHNYSRINSKKKKIIRVFFIAHGWIPKPSPRNIPVCKHCGSKYPLGKREQNNNLRKIKMMIAGNNHKRATKF